jgi:hypothetical protein
MTNDQIKRIYLESTGFDLDESDAALMDFARNLLAAQTPAPQEGDERAVSGLELAVIGMKHFGNPIPKAWYAAARELLAALASNKAAAVAATYPTPISISTDQIAEIANKYNLGNPRLDALRCFVNEVIIVNGAEYAKS